MFTKLTRVKIGLLAAAVCATALFVGARVAWASASGCTTGSSSGNVETCVSVIGSGLFVNEITASAQVLDSTRDIQVCIHGPDAALPLCTLFQSVSPGDPPIVQPWSPNRDVPAGEYCARTWRDNADGSHTLIGEICVDVHA